ncbi:MAG TPA: choline transporter, partial [Bordetella sp.]|nr:choline transporter [Bordetella sp.]
QTATIASALPFSVILLLAIWGLFKALKLDATKRGIRYQSLTLSRPARSGQSWERRLRNMVMMPRRAHVLRFIAEVATPALEDVADELRKQGYMVDVREDPDDGSVAMDVSHGQHLDFSYAVRPESFVRPSLTPSEDSSEEERKYFRAEVHLREGGQDYDIMGWSRDAVIGDILDQYERHRHYLHMVR